MRRIILALALALLAPHDATPAAPPPIPKALSFLTAEDRARFDRLWAIAHGQAPALGPGEWSSLERPQEEVFDAPSPVHSFAPLYADAISTNVRINDPTGDRTNETQDETAAASSGSRALAAWNDSKGFNNFGATNTLAGYGYSINGGQTWIDGGDFPRNGLGQGEQLFGDPGICMNRLGHCWFCSIYTLPNNNNAVAVLRGTFTGSAPVWNPPLAVSQSATDFMDNPYIACDPDHDYVYILYSRYFPSLNEGQPEVARSLDGGVSFDPAFVLQPQILGDWARGATVVVDDEGGVNGFWLDGTVRPLGVGQPSYLCHRRSVDHGTSYSPTDTVAGVNSNWYSSPPGSNRNDEYYALIATAADQSNGVARGTLYAAWEESADPIFDSVAATVGESEPNGAVAQAKPIVLPVRINGSVSAGTDVDFFSFAGTQGEMVSFASTVASTLTPVFQISSSPAADTLLLRVVHQRNDINHGWVTLPSTGTYTLRVSSLSSNSTGAYTLDVVTVTPGPGSIGRDHRDIAVAASHDHGATWGAPVIVNDDPPLFDQCEPMLAVDSLGIAHVFWYDRRNDPLRGGLADIYYSRSTDGGASWSPNVRVTDVATTWQVPTRGSPNFGDYSQATASGNTILPVWTDGRLTSPDVFTSVIRSGFALSSPGDTTLTAGDTLRVTYVVDNLSPFSETFRYSIADSAGRFAPADDSVAVGAQGQASIVYERIAPANAGPDVDDPLTLTGFYRSARLATAMRRSMLHLASGPLAVDPTRLETGFDPPAPNPFIQGVRISYRLARQGTAAIDAFDVSGRHVATLTRGIGAPGPHELVWSGRGDQGTRVPAGIYYVRADLDGRRFSRRVVYLGR